MICTSVRGERRIAAAQFFVDVLTTALEPDEVVTAIEFPKTAPGTGAAFEEISRRDGDFALAGVAAQISIANGTVSEARIAACGIGPASKRITAAEAALNGNPPTDDAIEAAASAVFDAADPHDDVHASAVYRQQLAAAMTRRALNAAIGRAQGQTA